MADQKALIPLTDEDVQARGKILARLVGELGAMREEHKEEKKAMAENEGSLSRRITKIARAIREGSDDQEP